MALTALALFVLWVLLAPVLRVLVQSRRTGDTGLRLTTKGSGPLQLWVGVASTTGICAQGAAAAAALLGLSPIAALDHRPLQWTGAALALLGTLGTAMAQTSMGPSWRLGLDQSERTALVMGGPFRWVRNPIYTTMFVTMLGIALVVPNPVSAAGLMLLWLSMEMEVRAVEEPYLLHTHGQAYRAYASTVGRFLPRVGRLR
ncbi:methyltransferase family protein [Streptomyces sp. NPDC057257]|uniref:methyltransferase family protein n=1 Tax=Streptomyces sp. NPDC057257 TaxID=3346071 RepID=UPI0036349CC3